MTAKRKDPARGMVRVTKPPSPEGMWMVSVYSGTMWRWAGLAPSEMSARDFAGQVRAAIRFAVERDREARPAGRKRRGSK